MPYRTIVEFSEVELNDLSMVLKDENIRLDGTFRFEYSISIIFFQRETLISMLSKITSISIRLTTQ